MQGVEHLFDGNLGPYRVGELPVSEGLDEQEKKMLSMCINYAHDPFGAPNHLLMLVVAKLYAIILNAPTELHEYMNPWK